MLETYYTTEEVAKQLKIPVTKVRELIRDGKLRASRVGKRNYRVPESAIGEYLKSGEVIR